MKIEQIVKISHGGGVYPALFGKITKVDSKFLSA